MTLYSSIHCPWNEFLDIIAELEGEFGEVHYPRSATRSKNYDCEIHFYSDNYSLNEFSTKDALKWFSRYFSSILPYEVEIRTIYTDNFKPRPLSVTFALEGKRI